MCNMLLTIVLSYLIFRLNVSGNYVIFVILNYLLSSYVKRFRGESDGF